MSKKSEMIDFIMPVGEFAGRSVKVTPEEAASITAAHGVWVPAVSAKTVESLTTEVDALKAKIAALEAEIALRDEVIAAFEAEKAGK